MGYVRWHYSRVLDALCIKEKCRREILNRLRLDTSLHNLRILPTGEAVHPCRRWRCFPRSELESQIES